MIVILIVIPGMVVMMAAMFGSAPTSISNFTSSTLPVSIGPSMHAMYRAVTWWDFKARVFRKPVTSDAVCPPPPHR